MTYTLPELQEIEASMKQRIAEAQELIDQSLDGGTAHLAKEIQQWQAKLLPIQQAIQKLHPVTIQQLSILGVRSRDGIRHYGVRR